MHHTLRKGRTILAHEFTLDNATELVNFRGDVNRHALIVKSLTIEIQPLRESRPR